MRPDLGVVTWFARTALSALYLSAVTVGELRYGIARVPDHGRRRFLDTWLAADLLEEFEGRILAVDTDVADRWGKLRAQATVLGKTLPVIDGLIAATALHHNLAIVTRNRGDLEQSGVTVVDPWTG